MNGEEEKLFSHGFCKLCLNSLCITWLEGHVQLKGIWERKTVPWLVFNLVSAFLPFFMGICGAVGWEINRFSWKQQICFFSLTAQQHLNKHEMSLGRALLKLLPSDRRMSWKVATRESNRRARSLVQNKRREQGEPVLEEAEGRLDTFSAMKFCHWEIW